MSKKDMAMRDGVREPPFSFWSGFLQGFSVGSCSMDVAVSPPSLSREGIKRDWQAIGGDMRQTLSSFYERRSA